MKALTKTQRDNATLINQAEQTSRLLDFDGEEWVEYIEFEGKLYTVYYIFCKEDITDDEGNDILAEDYDWSWENIDRIEEIE